MAKSETETPEGLRAVLAREHQELQQIFDGLLAALAADARVEASRSWAAFDDGLGKHMALEEKELLPLLRQQDAREVEALLREHGDIRRKLVDLGVGLDLHEIRVQTVSDFIEQLCRHAKREELLAYRWAEKNLPPGARDAMLEATLAARRQRRSALEDVREARASVTTR